MRQIGHWTPRYVMNRVRWEFFQRRHPDLPWLTPDGIQVLSGLLLPTDEGIEWGSGRSTAWFSRRLRHLTSIEHDTVWYERVRKELAEKGCSNVTYRYCERPREGAEAASDYVRAADAFAPRSLGFALVDGEAREFCVEAVVDKIAIGGVLVIDNANWFLDHRTHSPSSRSGRGPLNEKWSRIHERLQSWRGVWTTQGITDTAIWIRASD